MSEIDLLKAQVDELRQTVESFASEHADFRKVHISRRGLEGGRGPQGEQGPQGPQGIPGKDADITKVVEAALKVLESEMVAAKAALRWAVIEELKASGVIDAEGRAVPGPKGDTGADSTVPGPKGDTGPAGRDGRDGVDGKDGRDGVDGRDGERGLTGPQGERGERGERGLTGPQGERGLQGERGEEGLPGISGVGLSKQDVVQLILDMKKRGSI